MLSDRAAVPEGWHLQAERSAGAVCGACWGRGYSSDRHERTTNMGPEPVRDFVGKVLAFNPGTMAARLVLEETLHVGDKLEIVLPRWNEAFSLETMSVAQMSLSMALKGWTVAILVPRPVPVGTVVYRLDEPA